MNLELSRKTNIDVGNGDFYRGAPYHIPYFFETSYRRMMREPDETTITFKTWKGEYFQFYLDKYHDKPILVLTSTLGDSFYIYPSSLSLEKSAERFMTAYSKKTPIKGSFSGYYTYGKHLLEQYEVLKEHMAEQSIYFSDDSLEKIYTELKRRTNS